MTARNMFRVLSIVACAALMVTPALAGDGADLGEGESWGICFLDGAWLGSSPAWGISWPIVYDSDSYRTGTLSMRMVGGDPSLGGFFPADSLSRTTGTWVRTGRRTFDYTMIHYGLAADGQAPVFLAKLSGSVVLNGSCNQMEVINEALALYNPGQDPFGDEPPEFGCVPDGSLSTAQRIPVQPACEPTP